jgi:DNA-directed RNA polymerase subunit RPC12/RpoP
MTEPTHCPLCGERVDLGFGTPFTREKHSRSFSGGKIEKWQRYRQYDCPSCENRFAILERENNIRYEKQGEEYVEIDDPTPTVAEGSDD